MAKGSAKEVSTDTSTHQYNCLYDSIFSSFAASVCFRKAFTSLFSHITFSAKGIMVIALG
jgi:hypothetical protein